MNFASIKNCDIANGEGVRISLFVSGCTHACKNCFNSEAWDFNYGEVFGETQMNQILELLKPSYIQGLSLLGGEPMEPQNQLGLLPIVKKVKETYPDKTIWCYSGYLFDRDLLGTMSEKYAYTKELLSYIDVLVDGEFIEAKKDPRLRFRGSSNQRIIDVPKSLAEGQVVLWKDTNPNYVGNTERI